jgi:eukaryotic-like serine/threonine-protein kinase
VKTKVAECPEDIGAIRDESINLSGGMAHVSVWILSESHGEFRGGSRIVVKQPRPVDELAMRRMQREGEVLRRLGGQAAPRLVHDGSTQRSPWLAMEFIEGGTLSHHLNSRGPMRGSELRRFVIQSWAALLVLRQFGVAHRDLHPDNIVIRRGNGRPVLIDYGMAYVPDGISVTETDLPKQFPCAEAYAGPEVLGWLPGNHVGAEADIWAWASTVIFAATGRPPYLSRYTAGAARPHVPEEWLGELRDLCHNPDPSHRLAPRNLAAIAKLVRGLEPSRKRRKMITAVASSAAIGVAAVSTFFLQRAGSSDLTAALTENPFGCDGVTREIGRISGAKAGETIDVATAPSLAVGPVIAGADGTALVRFQCQPTDSSQKWIFTVRGQSSKRSAQFAVSGAPRTISTSSTARDSTTTSLAPTTTDTAPTSTLAPLPTETTAALDATPVNPDVISQDTSQTAPPQTVRSKATVSATAAPVTTPVTAAPATAAPVTAAPATAAPVTAAPVTTAPAAPTTLRPPPG